MPKQKKPTRIDGRYIPAELVEKIVLNLHLKPLLRFSLVSKSWNSTILASEFTKRYRGREMIVLKSKSNCRELDDLSITPPDRPIDDAPPLVHPFKTMISESFLFASCGELWCVEVGNSLYLWNPFLQTYRKLPSPSLPRGYGAYDAMGLVYGLGYDSVGDDYKFLKARIYDSSECELYSLRSNSWRFIQNMPEIDCLFTPYAGLSVNGALHWMALSLDYVRFIMCFDLSTEKYRELALPEYQGGPEHVNMTVLKGKLWVYVDYYYTMEPRFVMWKMEAEQSSWKKELDISYGNIPQPTRPQLMRPFYFYDNRIMAFRNRYDRGVILTWKDNSTLEMKNVGYKREILDSFVCVESLVSPDIWPRSAASTVGN